MTASASFAAQCAIDTTNPCGVMFDFLDADISNNEAIIDPNGMSGTRSRHGERTRPGLQHIGGPLTMEPNEVEMKLLLPWILGAAPSGNTYALAETLPTRYVQIDRVAKVFTYAGCAINS